MKNEKYEITCNKCKKSSKVQIVNDTQVMYIDHTPIIASRLRSEGGSMKWGFECMCGNDSRMSKDEVGEIDMLLQNASDMMKSKMVKNSKADSGTRFKMERL